MKLLKPILLLVLYVTSVMAASAPATDLYEPSHKTAEQLVRALTPVYGDEANFSTEGRQIIIRADQSIVDEIQALLLQLDHPSRVFRVEVSNSPSGGRVKTYSTNSRELSQKVFTLTENQPLIIAREQQTQQVKALRSLWRTVEIMPVQQEILELNLQAADNHVYIDFRLQTLKNGRAAMINNKVSGPLYKWLAVSGNDRAASSTITTYGTQRSDVSNLYIKVTPVD